MINTWKKKENKATHPKWQSLESYLNGQQQGSTEKQMTGKHMTGGNQFKQAPQKDGQ